MRSLLAAPLQPLRFGRFELAADHLIDGATVYAAGLGRRDAVALLLERGASLAFREPVYRNTALDAARYPHPAAGRPRGSAEVIALLGGGT
jgi:hypothetical protein